MLITEGAPGLALFEARVPRKSVNPNLLHFAANNRLALEACAAAGVGLYLFLRGFQLFARKPAVGGIPKIVVSAATPGLALISGSATGPRTLVAPITGKECYIYRTSIWQQESGGKKEWKNVAEETGHLTFLIEDPTGQLLVEPLGAKVDLLPDFSEEYTPPSSGESSTQRAVPEHVASFLARNGVSPDRPTRLEECCLQPASRVFVSGTLSQSATSPADLSSSRHVGMGASPVPQSVTDKPPHKPVRSETNSNLAVPAQRPEVIRLASGATPSSTLQMTQQSKIAAALSRAGLAQTDVWTSAEISVPTLSCAPVAVTEKTGSNPTSSPPWTMMKGGPDAIFVISNHSQFDLPTPLGWKSVALVVAGSSLTVLGLCILVIGRLPGLQ